LKAIYLLVILSLVSACSSDKHFEANEHNNEVRFNSHHFEVASMPNLEVLNNFKDDSESHCNINGKCVTQPVEDLDQSKHMLSPSYLKSEKDVGAMHKKLEYSSRIKESLIQDNQLYLM
jgi:hypothetical protein